MIIWICAAASAFLISFLLLIIYLSKDPVREVSSEENIVSPADGKVIAVIDLMRIKSMVKRGELKKGLEKKAEEFAEGIARNGFIIAVYSRLLDPNMNRAPADGEVIEAHEKKGRSGISKNLASAFENSRKDYIIKNSTFGRIKLSFITGFLKTGIKCELKKGSKVIKGERLGRLRLGGQTVIAVPDMHVKVKEGDRVKAGETVIAEKWRGS